ncbi:MAG: anaerobic glycerol-3-phosphate dehydrogenase subunit C [Planctomycetaceae bacterium]
MDERRQRILEDLTGVIDGELRCDPLTISMYSSDASLHQIAPLGVAFPRNREDVVALAKYAAEQSVPLIPRGSGTGVAGGALGAGLVVDFSRHMNRVIATDEDTVRVEPGIVRDRLNAVLARNGRYFPPDPSNSSITTVGGMLAVDAAGSHSVRVGSTRDHVQSIELVLAGGQTLEAGDEPLAMLKSLATGAAEDSGSASVKGEIVGRLARLLADHEELIRKYQRPLVRNCSGYHLRGVKSETHLHLPRLLVGSEGTLGLFTAATLHTALLPARRGVVLLLFGQLEAAARTVQAIAPHQPSACDLLDRRLLTLAREADSRFEKLISPAAEAALIIEQTGFSDQQVRDRIQMIIRAVRLLNTRAVVSCEAYSFEDTEFLWSLPSKVVPRLTRLKGQTRPVPFVEDIAVPIEALHDFLVRAQKVFQSHEVTASLYAHAAAGQLHFRPFLPILGSFDPQRIESIARDLYQVVFSVGGTISGEHGDGLSRTAFIRSQYGPLYRVFQQIKNVFDPHNLMNPGKIISDDAHLTIRHLRPPLGPAPEVVDLQLRWTPAELTLAIADCNGCGVCRTQEPEQRMCPFFRVDQVEEASPRSKANVLRDIVSGVLDPRNLSADETKRLTDLCFNCKQCQIECPSNVDIPHMVIEAKAAYVDANGLSRTDWLLSHAHSFGGLGSTSSLAANWVVNNPTARWVLEKLVGIARQRKLPQFARRSFVRSAGRALLRPPRPGGKIPSVVYFVGDYANYYDPELARAFVAILKHNGIRVHVPSGQVGSGMSMISAGDLVPARRLAEHNVRELAESARDGHAIVCTEPSAALCLSQEYPRVLDHPDVTLVASQVVEAGAFLMRLHRAGELRTELEPLDLDVGYHTPCHLRALSPTSPLRELLSLIPQLRVHTIEEGCSGMAGAWGLTQQNFKTSIQMGWGLISRMRDGSFDIGATECCSCKMQMEQGTSVPTLHPLKLLALSYGLMPEIRARLNPSTKKLVVT